MRKRSPRLNRVPARRGGTTLTEVLMALLVMGIGVVAVASLFPIALVRSVQATQLTEGTILRYNAEVLVDLKLNMIFDPDNDGNFGEHFNSAYLIDPVGAMTVRGDSGGSLNVDNITPPPDRIGGTLQRFDAMRYFYGAPSYGNSTTATTQAYNVAMLPDSWNTIYDAVSDVNAPFTNTGTSITIPATAGVNLADVANIISGGGIVRIVLFNQNLKMSEIRYLSAGQINAGTNTISWGNTLPSNGLYFPNLVPRIRIQVQERNYTWLLTVRNYTPTTAPNDVAYAQANVDVVIFFKRAPSTIDETPYNMTLGTNSSVYTVTYTGSQPPFKKGGFVLIPQLGEWRRIQRVQGNTITLERPLLNSNNQALASTQGVFMHGVIDVYPLGTKP